MTTVAAPTSASVAMFLHAEDALFRRHGCEVTRRDLDLPALGIRVRVLESGDGPALLFLPGLGAPAAVWAPLMAALGGFRCMAIDRPGCGLSDPMPVGGADLRHWSVRLVSAVVQALDLTSVCLVGNSIGGTTALWHAIDNPGRVDRIVTIGAPPFVLDSEAPLSMRLLSVPLITRRALARSSPAEVEATFVRMGHPVGTLSPEFLELAGAVRRLPGYVDGFIGILHSATGLLGRRVAAPAEELARIRGPLLMVWGANDTHGPIATGRRMVGVMPDARLEVRGLGHLPWLDDAAGCAGVIRGFLTGMS